MTRDDDVACLQAMALRGPIAEFGGELVFVLERFVRDPVDEQLVMDVVTGKVYESAALAELLAIAEARCPPA